MLAQREKEAFGRVYPEQLSDPNQSSLDLLLESSKSWFQHGFSLTVAPLSMLLLNVRLDLVRYFFVEYGVKRVKPLIFLSRRLSDFPLL